MFRRIFSCGGLLLLAGAVLFATPTSGWARAGHGGGAHFGGAHFGGARFGGGFGGYRGGFYHGGFYRGGYHPSYGYHHYYRPSYGGWGYPYYGYYGYGYYPYYGYGYSYYDPYLSTGLATSPVLSDGSAEVTPVYPDVAASGTALTTGYQSYSLPAASTGQPDGVARVTVTVPADAEVSFDGTMTLSKGAVRQYDSPPLEPGTRYTYDVKATWNENGREVTQTQRVEVTAGAHVNVSFPAPPKTTGQASAATPG
jgi:uncharacterized protein (TIGR03000 family)